jgi:energy-coupling factor transporter ATP-binding protein EcfA2
MARYALVIGIGQSLSPLPSLSKTVGDARAIAEVLRTHGRFEVQELTGTVTAAALEQAFVRFLEQAHQNEALIYYTGHGFPLMKAFGKTEAFLAGSDCEIELDADQRVVRQSRGLSLSDLNGLLSEASLSNLVMLLDCCHSGYLLEQELLRQTFSSFSTKDYFLITACRSFEQARAQRSAAHSVFTQALLDCLGVDRADEAGCVTGDALFGAVAAQLKGSGQEAMRLGVGRSLPIVTYQRQVSAPSEVKTENPYRGLLAFTKETQQFFFGREAEIQTLLRKVEVCQFVPLIGASGSGKSSVVRAGLMPWLETRGGWRVLEPITPGTNPLETLQSLIPGLYMGDVIEPSEAAHAGCRPFIPGEEKILLVVDQFEEVFTLCRDRLEQSQFIQTLFDWADGEKARARIVVTMRADFVDACLAHAVLTRAIEADAVWLGPLEGENLEAAIANPAQFQGVTLQERLLARILKDVEAEVNCLPLLEFALQQLWEQRVGTELTLAAYDKLGGVTGALNAHAEAIYKQLAGQKREHWVHRVMLLLVRTGKGTQDTRQRRTKQELLAMGQDMQAREAIEAVIQYAG